MTVNFSPDHLLQLQEQDGIIFNYSPLFPLFHFQTSKMVRVSLCGVKTGLKTFWAIVTLLALAACPVLINLLFGQQSSSASPFPAIYNFGDSNSDTGSVSATFGRFHSPFSQTFFGRPSDRFTDGRLMIDFMAEKLGLPYLSPYLDSIESNFMHGANFAAAGSTIQPANGKLFGAGFNPLSLDIQLLQFQQLKERTAELSEANISRLPRAKDFSKALYTLDCGQNDLHYALISLTREEQVKSIPNIISEFSLAIEKLYQGGGRRFWIHNTGPIGCLPYFVMQYPPKPGDADQIGCVQSYNEVAKEFNKQLSEKVAKLRTKLSDALLVVVDTYSAKYSLLSQAKKYGFEDPLGPCCGHFRDYVVRCGETIALANGTEVFGGFCSDPSKFINLDGIHYSEAANRWVTNRIMDGSLSDPPKPLAEMGS